MIDRPTSLEDTQEIDTREVLRAQREREEEALLDEMRRQALASVFEELGDGVFSLDEDS